MIRLNIHEAKTHLSRYIDRILKGEVIILCRRNIPVAEIRPILNKDNQSRKIGISKGKYEIPKKFFDPLPDDIISLFSGESE